MSQSLCYLHLYWFVYCLREELGRAQAVEQNHAQFWSHLPPRLQVPLAAEAGLSEPEYVELLRLHPDAAIGYDRVAWFGQSDPEWAGDVPVDGFHFPVRLGDTYSLLAVCAAKDPTTPYSLSCLRSFQQKLQGFGLTRKTDPKGTDPEKTDLDKTNLGQTWTIAAYRPAGCTVPDEEIAWDAYTALTGRSETGRSDPQIKLKPGRFLGASVFEIAVAGSGAGLASSNLVWVMIYPDRQTMAMAGEFYGEWLRLFCFRHKMRWAYENSRRGKRWLLQAFAASSELPGQLTGETGEAGCPAAKLSQLREVLQTRLMVLSQGEAGIHRLAVQQHTIQINLENYEKWLRILVEKAGWVQQAKSDLNMALDLPFLQAFKTLVVEKYQKQIEIDLAALTTYLQVQERVVDTVRGLTEIEQARLSQRVEGRDRAFQKTLQVAGLGLATATITATIVVPLIKPLVQPVSLPAARAPVVSPGSAIALVFFGCLLTGAVASGIAFILLERWRDRER